MGPTGIGGIPNGYDGLNWNTFGVIGEDLYPSSGYHAVINSPTTAALNSRGAPASFSSSDTFDLQNGYFAAAWNNDLHISFLAYDHGTQVGDAELELNPTKTFVDFQHSTAAGAVSAAFNGRFTSIDEVKISTSDGTNAGLGGFGQYLAMDDLQLAFKSGDGDQIQVPTGTDISKVIASAQSNGSGGTVLSGVPGLGSLTLVNTNPSSVSASWFTTT